jgi:2-C-methyl-D-erythritol 4-phosphate cytidylyltransferase
VSVATWAIVVAGGDGHRFGRPKQFERLAGRLVVTWAVDAAQSACDEVVLVLPGDSLAEPTYRCDASIVVAGGPTRSASVRAGLGAIPNDVEIIVIHDAARPLASTALFRAVIAAVREGADAAVPGIAVADTLKRVDNGRVLGTIERSDLVSVQTPQAFKARALREAHRGGPDATDDAGLIEAIGGSVAVVLGEPRNIKLTELSDLALFDSWLTTSDEASR